MTHPNPPSAPEGVIPEDVRKLVSGSIEHSWWVADGEAARHAIERIVMADRSSRAEGVGVTQIEAAARRLYEGARERVGKNAAGEYVMPAFDLRDHQLIDRDLSEMRAAFEAAALSAIVRNGWRTDMENAPRDGSAIIVALPGPGPTEPWIIGEAHWAGENEDAGWWWAQEGPGDEYAEKLGSWLNEPTHWRPLPASPGETP